MLTRLCMVLVKGKRGGTSTKKVKRGKRKGVAGIERVPFEILEEDLRRSEGEDGCPPCVVDQMLAGLREEGVGDSGQHQQQDQEVGMPHGTTTSDNNPPKKEEKETKTKEKQTLVQLKCL